MFLKNGVGVGRGGWPPGAQRQGVKRSPVVLPKKGPPGRASPALRPWFDLMGDALAPWRVIFGHWSSLGLLSRPGFIALDTGCAWGGALTAVRFETKTDNIAFVSCACS